jgi:ABC-2 type transport system permease protein
MFGFFVFAFLLAGLSLVYKKIGVITVVLNYLFLFFTGITLSERVLPPFIDLFSKCLPITWGSINLKNVVLEGISFYQMVGSSDFWYLIINSVVYLIIGLTVFGRLEKKARMNGNLGQY